MPMDAPGSVTFDGDHVIVANESSIVGDNAHMGLLDIAVGERGLPLALPPAPVYKLSVSPTRPRAGHRTRFTFTATLAVGGGPTESVPGAKVRLAGHTAVTNGQGRSTIRTTLDRACKRYRPTLVVGGQTVANAIVTATR
jgi:hypothetical protein